MLDEPLPSATPRLDTPPTGVETPPRSVVLVANAGGGIDLARGFLAAIHERSPDAFLLFEGQGLISAPQAAEQLASSSQLPVVALQPGTPLQRRTVYVVPDGCKLALVGGRFELEPSALDHGPPSQLDESCASLARALGQRLVFVALAGSLSDGVEGATEVLANGGLVAAAITRGPQQGHLPQAVRRRCTGVVAAGLTSLMAQLEPRLEALTQATTDVAAEEQARVSNELLQTLERLDEGRLTRFRSDHLLRRAELRRVSLGLASVSSYRERLESDVAEQRRFLQSVRMVTTRLFDDRPAIDEVRETVLPRLEELVPPTDELRTWVPRCGRGHDAFTLAIVLEEWARENGRTVRIFATDEDRSMIEHAITGRVTLDELTDVSEELRETYAMQVRGGWELQPRARRHLVFSEHDVVSDAPYPRLHLVFFRRSLLALRQAFRKHALDRIRFGLVSGGVLVVGEAEEPTGFETEFEPLGETGRSFLHRPTSHGLRRFGSQPLTARPGPKGRSASEELPPVTVRRAQAAFVQLLEGLGAAALQVDEEGRLLHAQGEVERYLSVREGPASGLVDNLIDPEFRPTLRRLLEGSDGPTGEALAHRVDGSMARILVCGPRSDRTVFLLPGGHKAGAEAIGGSDADHDLLRSELGLMRDELLGAVRELEARNDELSAYNEELQSSNEELHAVNEELHSVNEEYQRKIAEQMTLTDDLENVLRNSEVGVLFLDENRCIRHSTPAVRKILPLLIQDHGRPIADLAHHLEGLDIDTMCAEVLLDGVLRREVGKHDRRSFLVSARPYADHRGVRTGVVVEFMDITTLEVIRTQLARSEQQFRQLAENIREIFWIRDVDSGAFRYISPAFESVWARSTEEILDDEHCWWRWVHDADRERARAELAAGLHRFDYSAEYRVVRADGHERWIRDRGFPIEDADGVVRLMAGLAEDITELKEQEQELIAAAQALDGLAHHDPLTGILNRRGLERELVQERSRAARAGERLVAILCDCDDFKRVNDRLGHAAGDAVLQSVSHTLERTLRPTDHLARVGGDEFIALLSAARLAEAVQVAERLRRAIADTTVRIGDECYQLTASFGVSSLPEDLGSVEELVAHSQRALAASKRRGKNQVSSSEGGASEDAERAASDADRVVQGLLEGTGLTAYAQPLVRLTDSEVIGYELLIRGPKGPFHDPESLFGLAMERNLLTLTDLAALQTCLAAARAHIRPDAKLHVNLLPSTLLDLTDERIDELFDIELDPARICVEISEQQFIGEPSYLEAPVQRLRRRGLGVGLDDVGFGRSSLETLVLLEPEVVKLDRSQVTGAARSPQRLEQLRRLVKVARHGCELIVAEGVEFEEDEQILLELGIETAQGFRLGRPHPVERDRVGAARRASDGERRRKASSSRE